MHSLSLTVRLQYSWNRIVVITDNAFWQMLSSILARHQ
jgi:hypothetical protein